MKNILRALESVQVEDANLAVTGNLTIPVKNEIWDDVLIGGPGSIAVTRDRCLTYIDPDGQPQVCNPFLTLQNVIEYGGTTDRVVIVTGNGILGTDSDVRGMKLSTLNGVFPTRMESEIGLYYTETLTPDSKLLLKEKEVILQAKSAILSIKEESPGVNQLSFNGKWNIPNTLEFDDNVTALTGGLVVGDVYRTGDILKIVH